MNLLICKKAEQKLCNIPDFLLYFFWIDDEDNSANWAFEFLYSVESQTIGARNVYQLDLFWIFKFVRSDIWYLKDQITLMLHESCIKNLDDARNTIFTFSESFSWLITTSVVTYFSDSQNLTFNLISSILSSKNLLKLSCQILTVKWIIYIHVCQKQ